MTTCKGCGRKIEWGVTADGKRIPLDPSAPAYTILNGGPGSAKVERANGVMVSHFATCSKANDFSGRNR